MDPMPVLVINLDRAVERRERIAAALARLGLHWQRLPAVDGSRLSPEERAQALDEATYRRRHGMQPIAGELGCHLSHLLAMRTLLDGPHPHALVLEDDCLPGDALPAVLRALARCPERWDMVKLSAVHRGTPCAVHALTSAHALTVMLSQCTGSSAYVLNRGAAETYLRALQPMRLPFDHAYDRAWALGLKVRRVDPLVVAHDASIESSIARVSQAAEGQAVATPPRKFARHRRLPAYAWRLGNEARRLAHGLATLLAERVWRRREGAGVRTAERRAD